MNRKKPQKAPSAAMQNAHTALLKVVAEESVGELKDKFGALQDAIASGQLKKAYEMLAEFGSANRRIQQQISSSAKVLGVELFDDDDDDDC